ncbi:hypothetical protein LWI29_019646 [Acer saccharum]|uniref:Bulb-type lectin domain-containing protein n=1 Tax=Acer saccharum TaxID=4024 RepID=A0AA39V8H0_ACESA|nr:hypothetical protein LWI29_019646 [Acer saccharum]
MTKIGESVLQSEFVQRLSESEFNVEEDKVAESEFNLKEDKVANRNRPLKDASGVVTISEDGNLVVLNGQKEVLWSSNVSNPVTNASAQVLGSGNLVLNNNTGGSIWESFGQPTDTLMRRMRLSTDTKTGKKIQLTSWTSNSDPSIGSFSAGISSLTVLCLKL